jgi:hypothetical protein
MTTYSCFGHDNWRLEWILVSQQDIKVESLNAFIKELALDSAFVDFKLQ